MEQNIERLQKDVKSLETRVLLLEKYLINSAQKVRSKYDGYIDLYLAERTINDFVYVETKEAYRQYRETRSEKHETMNGTATMRYFNAKVKEVFPLLEIVHMTRNGANLYRWQPKGDV